MTVRPLDEKEIAAIRSAALIGKPASQIAHEMRVPIQWVQAYIEGRPKGRREIQLERARKRTAEIKAARKHTPPKVEPSMADLLSVPAIPKRPEIAREDYEAERNAKRRVGAHYTKYGD